MSAILKPAPANTTGPSIDELVAQWIEAKRAEDAANTRRVELEADIIAMLGEPDEGSQTHELADGSKLTIVSKITRTVDESIWRTLLDKIPENLRPISFVETAKLDLKGLRWLHEHQPEVYAYCAQAITARKAKSSISLRV